MVSAFTRTSVTVDEAVAILLGWTNGPILFRPLGDDVIPEEQDEAESQIFVLSECLDEKTDLLESELAEAIFDKLPRHDIDAKRAALQKHKTVVNMANTYLCAINAELNEGETSELRVDVGCPNTTFVYITMASLSAWAAKKGYRGNVLVRSPTIMPVEAGTSELGIGEERPCQQDLKPKQRRRDALAAELEILLPTMQNPTPSRVMAELRSRIGNEGTVITANMGDGLKWENDKGSVKILKISSLAERIRLWESRKKQG